MNKFTRGYKKPIQMQRTFCQYWVIAARKDYTHKSKKGSPVRRTKLNWQIASTCYQKYLTIRRTNTKQSTKPGVGKVLP